MEDLLSPVDGPLASKSKANDGKDSELNKDLDLNRFEKKLKARKAFNLAKQTARRVEAKKFGQATSYTFRKRWMFRRANVPPEILQSAIDRDKELKRLNRIQQMPYRERKQETGKLLLSKELPRLKAKLSKLKDELTPYFNKVMLIDSLIRKVLNDMEFVRWWARRIKAQTDGELKQMVSARIKRIAIAEANKILARQQLELRCKHGNWGKKAKRYPLTSGS